MDELTKQPTDSTGAHALGPDKISVRRWYAVSLLLLLGSSGVLAYLLQRDPLAFDTWATFKS